MKYQFNPNWDVTKLFIEIIVKIEKIRDTYLQFTMQSSVCEPHLQRASKISKNHEDFDPSLGRRN